jgi:hypothetical protein
MPSRLDTPFHQQSLLPEEVIAKIRPEVPGLCEEIIDEICESIPGYAPLINGPYELPVRRAVERNVTTFVRQLSQPTSTPDDQVAVCRDLGRLQALQQGELTVLEEAIRIGVRVAWRRCVPMLDHHDIAGNTQSLLADRLFAYVDELISHARAGYRDAAHANPGLSSSRATLARMLLDTAPDQQAIELFARQCRWQIPATVSVVALRQPAALEADQREEFVDDLLVDTEEQATVIVVPGEFDASRVTAIRAQFGATPTAVGPTVPLREAATSARWARRTLQLAEEGILEVDGTFVHADEHLLTLWLTAEPWLASRLLAQQLAPLEGSTHRARHHLTETLRSWTTSQGNVAATAAALRLHPQTVRYRVKRLRNLLGAAVDDSDWLLATQLAFRAVDAHRWAGRRNSARRSSG